jgi:hypothetical protein
VPLLRLNTLHPVTLSVTRLVCISTPVHDDASVMQPTGIMAFCEEARAVGPSWFGSCVTLSAELSCRATPRGRTTHNHFVQACQQPLLLSR